MAIKLTKVPIGENRYFHKFKRLSDGNTVTVATIKSNYDQLGTSYAVAPTYAGYEWVQSWSTIGFDSPARDLADKEYATQANGAHWVKISGYPTTKLPNEYVDSKGFLTDAGEAKIIELNNNE